MFPTIILSLAVTFVVSYLWRLSRRSRSSLSASMDKLFQDAANRYPPGNPQRLEFIREFMLSMEEKLKTAPTLNLIAEPLLQQIYAVALSPPMNVETSEKLEDKELLILYLQDARALLPVDNPHRARLLSNLGHTLWERFKRIDHLNDLTEAIAILEDAIQPLSSDDTALATPISNLACCLVSRYERLGSLSDLETAISHHKIALALRPPGHEDRDFSLNDFGAALWCRYRALRNPDDLQTAIAYHTECLSLRPTGHPNRRSTLVNLAADRWLQYVDSGEIQGLNDSIQLYEESLNDDPDSLDNLAVPLRARFRRLGKEEDLNKALSLQLRALPLRQFRHRDRGVSLNNLGLSLHCGYDHGHGIDVLDSAISYYREALDYYPEGDWERPSTLNNLGHSLHSRFKDKMLRPDLDEAIYVHREALKLADPGDSRRRRTLTNLGAALVTLCTEERHKDLLDEAIDVLSEACANESSLQVDVFTSQNTLGCAFWLRYNQFGTDTDFTMAVEKFTYAADLANTNKDKTIALSHLGLALQKRFSKGGDPSDLSQAIAYGREAVSLLSGDNQSSSVATAAGSLALALETRFSESRDVDDLNESTKVRQLAIDASQPGAQGRHIALSNLGENFRLRFEAYGQLEDLEKSIEYARQARSLIGEDHPDYSGLIGHLAGSLSDRYDRSGNLKDLEEAIELHTHSVHLKASGHPGRCFSLNNVGTALFRRFDRFGATSDLEDAITYLRDAKKELPPFDAARFICIPNFSSALLHLFEITKEEGLLCEAFDSLQTLIKTSRTSSFGHFNCLISLGNVYLAKYEQYGDPDALQSGIECLQKILLLQRPAEADRYKACLNLGIMLKTRYGQSGSPADLELAVEYHREAYNVVPENHTQRPSVLMTLGNTLMTRFQILGILEDLEETIRLDKEALESVPDGDVLMRYKCMNNIGIALQVRYDTSEDERDLEDAISFHRLTLDLIPSTHIDRPMALDNLGNALLKLFTTSKLESTLVEAMQRRRQALELRPPGNIDRYLSLYNLGAVLLKKYQHDLLERDLVEATNLFTEAKNDLSSDHPAHSIINVGLSCCLTLGSDPSENRERPYELFAEAANHRTATSRTQLDAALMWVTEAVKHEHASTLQAYSRAITLLECSVLVNPTIETQRDFLTHLPKSLACDSCAYAIQRGRVEEGVKLLEQGRSILWNRLRGYRHPLEGLMGTEFDGLVKRFESLSAALEGLATSSETGTMLASSLRRNEWNQRHALPFEIRMRHQRLLLEDWDACVDEIRKVDGYQDFLRASSFRTLRESAAEGPVIITNISEVRCDGIILRKDLPPEVVPLPKISPAKIATMNQELERSLALSKESLDADAKALGVTSRQLWNSRLNKIQSILRSLWKLIVHPIVQMLGVEEMSRIWWVPTAELTGMPIHAAGPFAKGKKDLPDLYVSSYTPTLSSLIQARKRSFHQSIPSFLAVGIPDEKLRHVNEEIEIIRSHIPQLSTLMGEDVTPARFKDSLPKHSWIHVACHGYWNVAEPFRSSFCLSDGFHFSILDLTRQRLLQGEFAFLSACFAAVSDPAGTPDEVINLAAALQFSGFRSVVGTLWELIDKDAPLLADGFYKNLFRGDRPADIKDTARALNAAVNELRRQPNMTPHRWIQIIHIGA